MYHSRWIVVAVLASLALVSRGPAATSVRPTTDGTITLGNLDAQIEGLEQAARSDGAQPDTVARLVDLLETRGRFRGRVADYERAVALAEALVRQHPGDARSHLTQARTLALLHRFAEARGALARAREHGGDAQACDRLQASLDQATGSFAAALVQRNGAAASRSAIELGARGALHGERAEIELATQDFVAARRAWHDSRDVSPFVPAWLAFEEGILWMRHGDMPRAQTRLREATEILPGYVPAQGHLAEVEAELGHVDEAITRLRAIVPHSDDPDYAHQLARLLADTGETEEAQRWREIAARRFDELIAQHPLAFADHAAEFWLGIGSDPEKGLQLARLNASERHTPRAQELLARALGELQVERR